MGERDFERKATGCHFSSSGDTWKRTAPITKLELLASMQKGLVELGEMRTGAEVTLCFSLVNAVHSASLQYQLESFWVKLKSAGVFRKVPDELLVEVSEPEEGLHLLLVHQSRPLSDAGNLDWVQQRSCER